MQSKSNQHINITLHTASALLPHYCRKTVVTSVGPNENGYFNVVFANNSPAGR